MSRVKRLINISNARIKQICLLNVNLNAVDVAAKTNKKRATGRGGGDDYEDEEDDDDNEDGAELVRSFHAHSLLHDIALVSAMIPRARIYVVEQSAIDQSLLVVSSSFFRVGVS